MLQQGTCRDQQHDDALDHLRHLTADITVHRHDIGACVDIGDESRSQRHQHRIVLGQQCNDDPRPAITGAFRPAEAVVHSQQLDAAAHTGDGSGNDLGPNHDAGLLQSHIVGKGRVAPCQPKLVSKAQVMDQKPANHTHQQGNHHAQVHVGAREDAGQEAGLRQLEGGQGGGLHLPEMICHQVDGEKLHHIVEHDGGHYFADAPQLFQHRGHGGHQGAGSRRADDAHQRVDAGGHGHRQRHRHGDRRSDKEGAFRDHGELTGPEDQQHRQRREHQRARAFDDIADPAQGEEGPHKEVVQGIGRVGADCQDDARHQSQCDHDHQQHFDTVYQQIGLFERHFVTSAISSSLWRSTPSI